MDFWSSCHISIERPTMREYNSCSAYSYLIAFVRSVEAARSLPTVSRSRTHHSLQPRDSKASAVDVPITPPPATIASYFILPFVKFCM